MKMYNVFGCYIIFLLSLMVLSLNVFANNHRDDVEQDCYKNFIIGDSARIHCNDFSIWYEVIGNLEQPTVMLFSGLGNSATMWPNAFVNSIVNQGYSVIRFDHRETGFSSWDMDWSLKTAYDLSDVASDAFCIVEHLGIESVHLAGISLGGMIAQTFAINYPERAKSLTIINSTSHFFKRKLLSVNPNLAKELVTFAMNSNWDDDNIENKIKAQLDLYSILKRGDAMQEETQTLISDVMRFDHEIGRIRNPDVKFHQIAAVLKSGSRDESLRKLKLPSLIFHGKRDPLIDFSHGERLYVLLDNAQFEPIENMTHVPTKDEFEIICKGLINFLGEQCMESAISEN